MKKIILFLFITLKNYAQNEFVFINDGNDKVIENYSLSVYVNEKETKHIPDANFKIKLEKKTIRKADSIILKFDSWYKEKLTQKAFRKEKIYVNKQIALGEVFIDNKEYTIGTYHKGFLRLKYNYKGHSAYGIGQVISFPIDTDVLVKKMFLRIGATFHEETKILPVLFLADSINDVNKIHIYPVHKPFIIKGKIKRKWVEFPIAQIKNTTKTKIFAGYMNYTRDKQLDISTVSSKHNVFLDTFRISEKNITKDYKFVNLKSTRHHSRERYRPPAIKIVLDPRTN
ncbi:hypothetical protein [Aureivirga sp. CE67]|uniref:hypothetical protein n=1 Tax=Aureivirga sp. CE67 TaxID=1788983 RepID=UPI0018CB5F79|nr:hypothetical protein [Aureivirga sp. CE67]